MKEYIKEIIFQFLFLQFFMFELNIIPASLLFFAQSVFQNIGYKIS